MSSFTQAKREKLNLAIALMGTTGSGKTLGALLLAYGLTGDWSKVFVIDADNRSSLGYVDDPILGIGRFQFASLDAPYTPQKYLALLKDAAESGAGCIIVDTISQEWAGEGGTLEKHDAMQGNSYTNWAKVNPDHYALMNWLSQKAPCHTITNLRAKMKHEIEEYEDGGQKRKRVSILGEGPIARPNTEYEFHLTFMCDRTTFKAEPITKRGNMLTNMDPIMLSVELGQKLRAWAESGEVVENLAQSKQRLIKELREAAPEAYPDATSVATAMKKCVPPLVFDSVERFAFVKAQLLLESAAVLVNA